MMNTSLVATRPVTCQVLAQAIAATWKVQGESDEMGEVGQALCALVFCLKKRAEKIIEIDSSGNRGVPWHVVLEALRTTPGIIDPHPLPGYPLSSLARLDTSRIIILSS